MAKECPKKAHWCKGIWVQRHPPAPEVNTHNGTASPVGIGGKVTPAKVADENGRKAALTGKPT